MSEPQGSLPCLRAAKISILSGEGTWTLPDAVALECAALAGRDFGKLPRCLFKGAATATA